MDSNALNAFESADAILAAKGRSFYWARHMLGASHAARATRLYGFCRYIDDLADEAVSIEAARRALEIISSSIASGKSDDLVIIDMIRLINECQIDPKIVQELIKGVTSDLDTVRIADEAELLRYCYRVAGTVGLMMCGALDVHNIKAYPYAIDLGIAMQLTNICRDVAADAEINRRYLPATLLGDIDPAALINPKANTQFCTRQCILAILDLADQYYKSGEAGLACLPLGARSGILVAARIYRAIGAQLRHQNYDYWTKRAVVSKSSKTMLTAQALLSFPFKRSLWMAVQPHQALLHSALAGLPGVTFMSKAAHANRC
jgi:15-cis-phytoene synthase